MCARARVNQSVRFAKQSSLTLPVLHGNLRERTKLEPRLTCSCASACLASWLLLESSPRLAIMLLTDLPDEVLVLCALQLVMHDELHAAQRLQAACKTLHRALEPARAETIARWHTLRWSMQRLESDVIIRSNGRGLRLFDQGHWRRAFGRPLLQHSTMSRWGVRIDNSKGNQGLMQIGVAHVQRGGTCEWSVSPFYGRLIRRLWDGDGNLIVGAPPPEGHPDGHLKHMLVDENGEPVRLEGRAFFFFFFFFL